MRVLCAALFACAFNLMIGYVGLLSFGHAAFFGMGSYVAAWTMKFWHVDACVAIILGGADRRGAGPVPRLPGDPPLRHLLRDDHAGAGADGVLLLPGGAVHRRRGRHPASAARPSVRLHRPEQRHDDVLGRGGGVHRRVPADPPHHPLAVRPGAEGDPRERAARHLAGLSHRRLQADRVRAVLHAVAASPAAPRRWCSASRR